MRTGVPCGVSQAVELSEAKQSCFGIDEEAVSLMLIGEHV